ncbi:MAG: amidohydrolase family protein [Dehalococcoidia bacterium]|nr:amidohydrolase family protein [Dehalococcoidia bacterium]MDD5493483.1 amidohydrolase family protein [Dehalococcoidia bacterium]
MATKQFKKDGYFKIDPEAHLIGDMTPYNYYPGVKMWWDAIANIRRPLTMGAPVSLIETLEPDEMVKNHNPQNLLNAMDKYGVDIACLLPESMMDTTLYSSRWVSNGDMAKVVDSNPDRFMYEPNVSPIKFRGVKNAIWELEYWVKEKGAKIFKYYPPEDTYINDEDLWPFYKRAEELDIVLDIHTGMSWCPPGKSKYAVPILLDDVARDFPHLKIIAFHMGYPYCDELNMIAMGHPNITLCLTLLVPWAIMAPRKFAKIIGEALRFVGPDRITWGVDYAGYAAQMAFAVTGLREFQIPLDMQESYGYPAITDEDRAKIFGLNLARLMGIDTKRRI